MRTSVARENDKDNQSCSPSIRLTRANHRSMPVAHNKKILITGCGRSGTKYITFVLRRLGVDVRHERMGRDGVASWYMAVDTSRVPFGQPRRGTTFEHIYHQVRHPLQVIASAATFKEPSWQFICAHSPISMREPLLLRSLKYWYYWNLEAEKIAHWRYRIEDFPAVFPAFCERLRVAPNPQAISRPACDVNTRAKGRLFHLYEELCERLRAEPYPLLARWLAGQPADSDPPLSWLDLRSVHPEWTEAIRAKALQYGYTT
jgi:hypothetical protein